MILLEIVEYCEICPIKDKCIEEECVLYRIEIIILKDNAKKKGKKKYERL